MMKTPKYDLRKCTLQQAKELVSKYHGYGGAGCNGTYCFGVFEGERVVAAYIWSPPALGAARAVCPNAPWAVLGLSRMVAVPKKERNLKHISKPLKRQMKFLIDRTRWPVLVTYSDEGQGHSGFVYQCSGWEKTTRSRRQIFENENGVRVSKYSGGIKKKGIFSKGHTTIQRWENHWVPAEDVLLFLNSNGWVRKKVEGKFWNSGSQRYKIVKEQKPALFPEWVK